MASLARRIKGAIELIDIMYVCTIIDSLTDFEDIFNLAFFFQKTLPEKFTGDLKKFFKFGMRSQFFWMAAAIFWFYSKRKIHMNRIYNPILGGGLASRLLPLKSDL